MARWPVACIPPGAMPRKSENTVPLHEVRRPRFVLIVDDDESVRLLLADILVRDGYQVECAVNGAEAIRMLRGPAPDLMILDLLMPGTSGWDVLEFMEERPRLSTIPVVVLTAFSEGEETPSGRPVIHKPVDADLLRRLLSELLEQSRATSVDVAEVPSDLLPRPRHHRSGAPPKPG
jgi:two-component system, chemotaxis family, chemotaxis protein CheY